MIIYSMEHFSAFDKMLILRLTKHRNEKAILIYVADLPSISIKKPLFDNLKNIKIFDDVICLPELPLNLYSTNTEEQTLEFLMSTYNPIFEEHKINLKTAVAIYEMYDWLCGFAIYLKHYNLPFIQFRSTPKRTSYLQKVPVMHSIHCSVGMNNLLKTLPSINEHNQPISKIIIFPSATFFDNVQLSEQEKQLIEVFDFYEQFDLISESDKQKILSCFDIDINFLKNKQISMLLPSSFGLTDLLAKKQNARFKDFCYIPDKYLLLYATMLQYFTDKQNEIVYHPHPTRGSSITNLEPLKQRNVKYIDANMPIEFLLWIPNIKIKQLLLLQSTAQNKLATMVDETTALTKEYIKVFNILDKLYVIQAIINRLTLHTNLKFYGISQKVFETMYKFNFSEYLYKKFAYQETCQNAELQPNDIFVINTTLQDIEPISNQNFILDMLNQAAENSIIFFTNIFGESPFIELLTPIFDENPATEQVKTTVSDFIVPIQIDRSPLDDGEQVGELGTTAIFAFCKNAKTRQYLREIRLTKNLQYLNVVLNVSPISEETAQSWMQQAYNHAVIAAVVNNFNNKIINQKNDEIRQKDSEIHRTNEIIQQSNEEIHQKNEEINHKNNEIYQKGEEINHKNNEIWQINETIHHKNEEIDHLKNRITELETSTSWKITKPLRNIKKAFWALIE